MSPKGPQKVPEGSPKVPKLSPNCPQLSLSPSWTEPALPRTINNGVKTSGNGTVPREGTGTGVTGTGVMGTGVTGTGCGSPGGFWGQGRGHQADGGPPPSTSAWAASRAWRGAGGGRSPLSPLLSPFLSPLSLSRCSVRLCCWLKRRAWRLRGEDTVWGTPPHRGIPTPVRTSKDQYAPVGLAFGGAEAVPELCQLPRGLGGRQPRAGAGAGGGTGGVTRAPPPSPQQPRVPPPQNVPVSPAPYPLLWGPSGVPVSPQVPVSPKVPMSLQGPGVPPGPQHPLGSPCPPTPPYPCPQHPPEVPNTSQGPNVPSRRQCPSRSPCPLGPQHPPRSPWPLKPPCPPRSPKPPKVPNTPRGPHVPRGPRVP